MAYNLENRFSTPPKYFKLLDPGAYQIEKNAIKLNKIPFNSSTPRIIRNEKKLWTNAIYNPEYRKKIENCSSLMSKRSRFPYESFNKLELEKILCNCGLGNICTCTEYENKTEKQYKCQGKTPKRMFKGPTKHSTLGDNGLSIPSKNDDGFEYLSNGSIQRRFKTNKVNPIFISASSNFATDFYRGWKWSNWTSPRFKYKIDQNPGPGNYNIPRKDLDREQLCAEKFRFQKRRKSKQLRYIEMIQNRNIMEGRPGPADYNPKLCDNNQNISFGKCARFSISRTETRPGPADHVLRRDFDSLETDIVCHAKLPPPAPFNFRSDRFKPRKDFGPSSATYFPKLFSCHFTKCSAAPFGSSAQRFKEAHEIESEEEDINSEEELDKGLFNIEHLSSNFKSKTVRFKPLVKNINEPSPADMAPKVYKCESKPIQLQKSAPFNSSEGRFMPWKNSLSVFGNFKTPGPGYYDIENFSKKSIAVYHGPLVRSPRFRKPKSETPAPNTYNIGGGIETILRTHNDKLKANASLRQTIFSKEPVSKQLTKEEQEWLLINKSINLLNTEDVESTH